MCIDRQRLVSRHNPVLKQPIVESPLTVGNGEFAFTADITGMQTLYNEYDVTPLCTMSQWGWHTTPVSETQYAYTLDDLVMTEYECQGRKVYYPKTKMPGNEAVYDWLRQNPHRLNLMRAGIVFHGQEIKCEQLKNCHQQLELYSGILTSDFQINNQNYQVHTACHNMGKDQLTFVIESADLMNSDIAVELSFPYGSPSITASDWNKNKQHSTKVLTNQGNVLTVKRLLDCDEYYICVCTDGEYQLHLDEHKIVINPLSKKLHISLSFYNNQKELIEETKHIKVSAQEYAQEILDASEKGWENFWKTVGVIELNNSKDIRAIELERRIILSQYQLAVSSCGSAPPQETGLVCNSWYGKMHLEMYLWHCAWLPLWNQLPLLERSLKWYVDHLKEARENAARNGYKGVRWPKMVARDAVDSPSPIAPLLVWQQPHVIYMSELSYRLCRKEEFLEKYWILVKETADFMVDFVIRNEQTGYYDIPAPVIPVQECHNASTTYNPAFELEYWRNTLRIAVEWGERLGEKVDLKWSDVAEHMAPLCIHDGLYMAHDNCPDTFIKYQQDHPSMLGAYGLLSSDRVDIEVMRATLHKIVECWDYQTLWGWDFALMAMTAIRLGEPELAINLLLKDTPKNAYLINGHNRQITRHDLPLYLPGNGSLLLAAAMMTAGYDGCDRDCPGFPKDGTWTVEYEGIERFL